MRTDAGNILWDCIATLDDASVTMIQELGGIDAIAISHHACADELSRPHILRASTVRTVAPIR